MNILLLCEGDAESYDSWSGIAKSLVDHLRAAGHTVISGDVDLAGADRWLAAAMTFAVDRRRWSTRYRLSDVPFGLRSRRAARKIADNRERLDVIIQVGATFQPLGRGPTPYFLCCDSNIRMAEHGAPWGYSAAVTLTRGQPDLARAREVGAYPNAAGLRTRARARGLPKRGRHLHAGRAVAPHVHRRLGARADPRPRDARRSQPRRRPYSGNASPRRRGCDAASHRAVRRPAIPSQGR